MARHELDQVGHLREAFGVHGIPALCALRDYWEVKSAGMPRTPNASRLSMALAQSIRPH